MHNIFLVAILHGGDNLVNKRTLLVSEIYQCLLLDLNEGAKRALPTIGGLSCLLVVRTAAL